MSRPSFRSHTGGAVALEFALVVPVMLVLLFGGYELIRMTTTSMRLNDAAQTIADLVSRQRSVGAIDIKNFCDGAAVILEPFPTVSFHATVASVTHQGLLFVVDWQDVTCGTGQPIPSVDRLAAPYLPMLNDSAIVVQVTYSYTPLVSNNYGASVSLTRLAYARTRNGATVNHS